MVKVKVYVDDNGRILGFEATGHAGAAPHGQDVVCAGVSALTLTAVNGLEHFLGDQALEVDAPGPGNLRCMLMDPLMTDDARTAQIILETMVLGLEKTAENYPRYLKMEKRRCLPC
ncbi:ribosomal-processing cysteine protease Prp [Heliobacterium chlorum]|uniref:Ribosomal processing cysteine protease Prp n=1 Tax=Heliobacterium chlorum TaxID=2698 RepID=A0ABR7SZD0_HELCL|nr:ribosomal-processing cysteine protease Prp [Heliobacterium chlorum]MBC9783888.1 ribosomal-processing cysteine protease Prp [Heliobacterium chlorum]